MITADSVKLTSCDSAELIIENHTQSIPGFLFNTGKGRTVFKRGAVKLSDSMYLIGADTLKLATNSWLQGGNSFGTTGIFGTLDNSNIDIYTDNIQRGQWTAAGNFLLNNKMGIGTTAPQEPLHIKTDSFDQGLLIEGTSPTIYATADYKNDVASLAQTGLTGSNFTFGIFGPDQAVFNSNGKGGLCLTAYSSGGIIDFSVGTTDPSGRAMRIDSTRNILIGGPIADNGNALQVSGTGYFSTGLAIGVNSPTAQLHTTGSVRFAGLTNDNTQTQVLVSDGSGNIYYRNASTLSANDLIRSSLAVNGPITAQKLTLSTKDWPDYVFDSTYHLPSLADVDAYIRKEHHLPGIPAAAAVEKDGLDVGASQALLMKKIEELTLYNIDQEKRIAGQSAKLEAQDKALSALQAKVEQLKELIKNR